MQNLTFADGNSTGDTTKGGGGGAILVRGGRFSVINSRFTGNRCDATGPDLGGAALRVLSQYHGEPVQVIGSRFTGGVCSNGGAISSIGVSWNIVDTVMSGNKAIGSGANPARSGTPGGGSGGAIYLDGNTFTLRVSGHDDHRQLGRRGRGSGLLRQQRPDRHGYGLRVHDDRQPQRRLRDRRPPGHVLPRRPPARDHRLDAGEVTTSLPRRSGRSS